MSRYAADGLVQNEWYLRSPSFRRDFLAASPVSFTIPLVLSKIQLELQGLPSSSTSVTFFPSVLRIAWAVRRAVVMFSKCDPITDATAFAVSLGIGPRNLSRV